MEQSQRATGVLPERGALLCLTLLIFPRDREPNFNIMRKKYFGSFPAQWGMWAKKLAQPRG